MLDLDEIDKWVSEKRWKTWIGVNNPEALFSYVALDRIHKVLSEIRRLRSENADLKDKGVLHEIYFKDPETRELIAGTLQAENLDLRAANRGLREAMKIARMNLDNLSYIPCEASVYTFTDDDFEQICYSRDILDLCLEKYPAEKDGK